MRQALALQPDNPALILDLGRLLRKSRRARAAVEILRQGLALQPGNAPLHYQLGLALADLGLTADSAAELEQARRLAGP
jgi:predicted Zn-dependent protease